ncbi:MAG: hypothetical protein IPO32_08715 [Crocinitomicaceae bacterium]|nr:hypothetical protein [Crocinitomicaceae bacterium]
MISIFSEHITPRLTYVLDFCFGQKGFEYKVISSVAEWSKIKTKRINYSHLSIPCDYLIKPHELLFEDNIREDLQLRLQNNELQLDGTEDEFALIFWMLTRYEEFLPHERDQHDRYKCSNSALFKLGVHRKPMADILVKKSGIKLNWITPLLNEGLNVFHLLILMLHGLISIVSLHA